MPVRFDTIPVSLLLAILLSQLARAQEFATFTGTTMGPIEYRVLIDSDRAREEQQLFAAAIHDELENVNRLMSTYQPDSEVSRFNSSTSTEWFDVSHDTAVVVSRALEISRASDGAFDFTVAPLVKLWNFGPDKGEFKIPSEDAIAEAMATVGYEKIEVRLDPPQIRKLNGGATIDLSAIAKGFAVDQVARRLEEFDQESYLVEVGGEVYAKGTKSSGAFWIAGVEEPNDATRRVLHRFPLENLGLASSGDYRNFFVVDGVRYSHTIDPRTGHPVQNDVAATSVIAGDCVTADAVATALMVLGPFHGMVFANKLEVEALIVTRERQSSRLNEFKTDGFPVNEINTADSSLGTAFLGALFVFGIAIIAMSIGVIFGRKAIKGSCGGLSALENGEISPECSLCSKASSECKELKRALKKREAAGSKE